MMTRLRFRKTGSAEWNEVSDAAALVSSRPSPVGVETGSMSSAGGREKVGIARDPPAAVGTLAHDRQRMARSHNCRAPVARPSDDPQPGAQISPIPADVEFLDLARSVELDALRDCGSALELLLAEGLPTWNQEDDIVRHERHDGRDITRLGGRHPGVDHIANVALVLVHD